MLAASADLELDHGPRLSERERLCVVTRTVRPIDEMIRFVVDPNGEVVSDLKSKLPGRGVWVTATRDTLEQAVKRKVFARGFKRDVRLPADLVAQTEALLARAVLDALAISGKGSFALTGFAKVESALAHDDVVILLHAVEAAANGVKKLDAAALGRHRGPPVLVSRALTTAQLDLALGRPNVIHAALLAGPSTDTFLARLRRWTRFQTGNLGENRSQNH